MSIEIMIVPLIFDLAALTSSMMEENRRVTVMTRQEKGMITAEEAAEMRLEMDALRRSGVDVRSGTSTDTRGSAVLIHTDQGYDLGLKRNAKGAYDIVSHWSQQPGHTQIQQVREDVEARIKQRYAHEKVKRELARKGFVIASEEVQPDNTIRLVARKW